MANEKGQPTAALIEVRQLPIIAERLRSVKDQVELAVQEATSLVCTEETVQAVKTRRAELRKQFDALEAQRKAVKAAVLAPYEEFEKVYRECISEPFKRADGVLRDEIAAFEDELKAQCRADLEEYHAMLCQVHGVDFLPFDMALRLGNIKIALSDAKAITPRKLQDALSLVVAKVADGMSQISQMDDAAEIMAEYKLCFDVGRSVATVQDRKRKIEAEREAAEARRARQAAQEAVVAKVAALAPPEEEKAPTGDPVDEERFDVTFTLLGVTRAEAVKVREFLKGANINYE